VPSRVAPLFLLAVLANPSLANEKSVTDTPPTGSTDSTPRALATQPLTGREIYERILANRHRSFFQKQRIVSMDAGGASATTELWTRWKDGRDVDGKTQHDVLSKTLAKYTAPRSVRGVGYLIVQKEHHPNDQFVYFPSAKRVRRVSLGESIMGTDFSIEDIVPRDIETSDYARQDDEIVDEVLCYVVELHPRVNAESDYSKLRVYVEKEHFVTIRTRYWNLDGIEVKEYRAPYGEIEEVDGVWLTRHVSMRNLVDSSLTTLYIDEIEPNASIGNSTFTVRKLEQRSR
jgi:hypothetical protein